MTITSQLVSKIIGQVLVLAALVAYWAPVVSYVGHKAETYLPMLEASAQDSRNTTIAYEVIDHPVSASTID
jgi:hypothetical protein